MQDKLLGVHMLVVLLPMERREYMLYVVCFLLWVLPTPHAILTVGLDWELVSSIQFTVAVNQNSESTFRCRSKLHKGESEDSLSI